MTWVKRFVSVDNKKALSDMKSLLRMCNNLDSFWYFVPSLDYVIKNLNKKEKKR